MFTLVFGLALRSADKPSNLSPEPTCSRLNCTSTNCSRDGIAGYFQLAQQRPIGVVLVILRVQQRLASLLEKLRERLVGRVAAADGQEVDAMSHQGRPVLEQRLACHGDADHDIGLLAETMDQQAIGGEQGRK